MPKFSIVIPVYNCIEYLPACVDSILNQAFQDFELFLIDDGATDGSGALCDELAEKYAQIKVIHKANGGAASARNVGIENACGDYLLFIDSDDTIAENTLELIGESAAETDMVIFGMAFDYYGKNEVIERTDILSCKHEGTYETAEIVRRFKAFFEDNALSSACNKCFQGNIIRENGLRFAEGMTLYEDLDFVLRYIKNTEKISCVGQTLYHYRLSADEKHLKYRVADIEKVQENLGILTKAMLSLKSKEATSVAANLYLQMLMRHLCENKYSADMLKKKATVYCSDRNFRQAVEQGAALSNAEADLLCMVDGGQYCRLAWKLRIRRIRSKIKRFIKRCLKSVGLYH